MSYISVDIGEGKIKGVHGKASGGKLEILDYFIIDTPKEAFYDGKIMDRKILVEKIAGVMKEKKIKAKGILLIIYGSGILVREIQIPKCTEEEIAGIIDFEARQYFPVDLNGYVVDFKVLGELVGQDKTVLNDVCVVAVLKSHVDEYAALAQDLKLDIKTIDVSFNVVWKFLSRFEKKKDNFAVLDLGESCVQVHIFLQNRLMLTRLLHWKSCLADGILEEELAKKCEEIEKIFEFHLSRAPKNAIDALLLLGGGSLSEEIEKGIKKYFDIPVYKVGLETLGVECKKNPDILKAKEGRLLINALGGLV